MLAKLSKKNISSINNKILLIILIILIIINLILFFLINASKLKSSDMHITEYLQDSLVKKKY